MKFFISKGRLGTVPKPEDDIMAVKYETIRSEVERLQNYVLNDLSLVVNQNRGGNYLAASLITCACDAIAYLKSGEPNRGDLVFAGLLPDLWKPVARNLYDAIRDGIVHVYETKIIDIESRHVSILISWGAKPHLQLSPNQEEIYINIPTLAEDLRTFIARFEAELKTNSNLRDTFYKSMHRHRHLVLNQKEISKWSHVLSQVPKQST